MSRYIYQPDTRIGFAEGVRALKDRGHAIVTGPIDITRPEVTERIRLQGQAVGMRFADLNVDPGAFRRYFEQAGYLDSYADYYAGNQHEKGLEHFIALTLLEITPQDVFIDIASEHSPVPEIFARITGARAYSQDIMYEAGVVGNRIGGDACAMPVPDGFATKATLTCSLEHFELDGDRRLFVELARVLRPGGAVCVVPFYVSDVHAVQTDPSVSVPADVPFDDGAPVYCVNGWGNRHGRFYSPESFKTRVVDAVASSFDFSFYFLSSAADLHPSIYARFALLATRRA